MNILGNNASKLNQVIFENRNKNYGAYAIRESYNDALLKSLLCLSSIICLLFGSVYAYHKMNTSILIDEKIIFDDPNITPFVRVVELDITPKPPVTPVEAAAPLGTSTPTTITDEPVEENNVTHLENPNTGLGNPNSNGVSPTSTLTSTNVIEAISPPAEEVAPTLTITDEMPVYNSDPNGIIRYVSNAIRYPEAAKSMEIQGTVYVSFVVSEFGKVEGVKIVKGIGYGCDEEVLKVINKMPTWLKAGKNQGRPVKVRYNIPVKFKLNT